MVFRKKKKLLLWQVCCFGDKAKARQGLWHGYCWRSGGIRLTNLSNAIGFPILYWLLDAAIINGFRIHQIRCKQKQKISPILQVILIFRGENCIKSSLISHLLLCKLIIYQLL